MTAIPGIRRTPAALRLRIDGIACTGHGVCVDVAPELFALDRFGYAYVLPEAAARLDVDAEARAAAREAATRCPAAAILVERAVAAERPPTSADSRYRDAARRLTAGPDGRGSLDGRIADGGFVSTPPGSLAPVVEAAGLCGHGGAHFPVTRKWSGVGSGEPVVIANGAEREPGTVKDRHLLELRPYLVLDGVRAVAAEVGARRAIVAVDEVHQSARRSIERANLEIEERGLYGDLRVEVATVPAAYVVGEETALIAALEGREPLPHLRPPFPTEHGLRGRPTVVHNIETLAQVALIAANGASWFRSAGTDHEPGTGLFSVGSFGSEPTVVEAPYGYPLERLLADAGLAGAGDAVIVGGWSGGMLPSTSFDVALTSSALAALGAALGTKSIQVVSRDRCPVGVAAEVLGYFGRESAGQCPPCHKGVPYLATIVAGLEDGSTTPAALDEARGFATTLPRRGACALPDGAARFLATLLRWFPHVVDAHLKGGCPQRSR